MNELNKDMSAWLWITFPIVLLLIIASGSGLFIDDLYRDSPFFAAQAKGQDLISLIVVSPILIVAAILAKSGSVRAQLVWLGVLVYLTYTYAVAAFDVRFNSLFLVYVALLGFALYSLIGGFVNADMARIKSSFGDETPVRTISIYLVVLVILFYVLWLSGTVPALLAGTVPQSVQENGTPTNAVHVLDMAWILPALGITAVQLWRRQPIGYTLAGAMLSYSVLLILSVMSMVLFMFINGHPLVIPQVFIFVLLFVTSLGMCISYLKSVRSIYSQS